MAARTFLRECAAAALSFAAWGMARGRSSTTSSFNGGTGLAGAAGGAVNSAGSGTVDTIGTARTGATIGWPAARARSFCPGATPAQAAGYTSRTAASICSAAS